MFTAVLICSDEPCDHADEFVGSLEDAEGVLCEGCGCLMQVVGIEGGHDFGQVVELRSRRTAAPYASRRLAA